MHELGNTFLSKDFNSNRFRELNNVINFVKGKKPNNINETKVEGRLKYLTIACLNGQELNYADIGKSVITKNDILMVMDGASSGDVYYSDYGIVGSTLSKIDIVDDNYIDGFIYFCFKKYNKIIKDRNTGSAIPHTDKAFVGNLKIPIINKEEQFKYKELLLKINQNLKENSLLEQLRDTLLPKLMNGKIDLNNIII